jgi:hypothetical protein
MRSLAQKRLRVGFLWRQADALKSKAVAHLHLLVCHEKVQVLFPCPKRSLQENR